jgi:hypothetical protein
MQLGFSLLMIMPLPLLAVILGWLLQIFAVFLTNNRKQ